jgi:hypothetical protein
MEPVTMLLKIGQLVPAVMRWFGKDQAAAMTEQAVNVAKSITGKDDAQQALDAIKASPEQLVEYQRVMNDVVIAQMEADTRALEATNATMRAEYASNDPYVRRARPTFLYMMAITWAVQALGLFYAVVFKPDMAASIINAAAALTGMWTVALTVVGVAVKSRSDDKARALGADAPSLTGALASSLASRRGDK